MIDVEKKKLVHHLTGANHGIWGLDFSPEMDIMISGGIKNNS